MWWARRGAGLPTAHGPAGGAVPGHGGTATTRSGHRAAALLLLLCRAHPALTAPTVHSQGSAPVPATTVRTAFVFSATGISVCTPLPCQPPAFCLSC